MTLKAKLKPCNGIGIAYGFEGCKNPVLKREHGLCDSCRYDFYTTDERGKIEFEKRKTKVKNKNWQQQKKTLKEKTTDYKSLLLKKTNEISRLIDKGLLCLARNQGGKMDAGHVFARGGNQTIRYNLHNVHRQSAQSNHWQNDDALLREGIIKEYGADYMDFIASLRQTPQLSLSDLEFKELSLKASKIISRLKASDKNYSLIERIELRNKINLELGIYDEKYCVFQSLTIQEEIKNLRK